MKWTIRIVCLAFAVAVAHAQTAVPVWVQRFSAPGEANNEATAMAVDGSGNVFVTGYSYNTPRTSDYSTTIAYSGAGTPLWTNRYSGPAAINDYATAIAVDASGNVFVTGYSASTNSYPYNYDYATIKYSGTGTPLWTNRYSGPGEGNDYAYSIAVDGQGDVIVTGYSASTNSYPYNYDYASIKYSSAGVPLWTNRYNGSGNGDDEAIAVALDPDGNAFVTGCSFGVGSSPDYLTVAYSGGGEPLWTNRYNGTGNGGDFANAIAVDASGGVVVTGQSIGNGSFSDYATIAYSSAGVPLWTNRYNGPGNSGDYARAIAVDSGGSVYVTGASVGNHYDFTTIQYSSAGVPHWTNRYNGPANSDDSPRAAAKDGSDNFFVTGNSFASGGGYDYATMGYSNAGVPLWTNRYNGPGNSVDGAAAIAVDSGGNVIVTGHSSSSGGGSAYATVKYSVVQPIPLAIQNLNHQVLLSWTNAGFGLQSAPTVTDTFTNVPGATSPHTNPLSGGQQFFRLISN